MDRNAQRKEENAYLAFCLIVITAGLAAGLFLSKVVDIDSYSWWIAWPICFAVMIPVMIGAYKLAKKVEKKYFS